MIDFDSLKPGRELDALVAQTVMGWRLLTGTRAQWLPPDTLDLQVNIYGIEPPAYSTDQSECLKVVNRIHHHGQAANYRFHELYDGFDLKEAKPGDIIETIRIDPFEICIAALKACTPK